MNLPELSLRRPVMAAVCSILIVVFGGIGYTFLGVREYPAIDPPNITVRTNYTGANAEVIESQITEPLMSIDGVLGDWGQPHRAFSFPNRIAFSPHVGIEQPKPGMTQSVPRVGPHFGLQRRARALEEFLRPVVAALR